MLTSVSNPVETAGATPVNAHARERLLAIGRAGRTWEFLLPAVHALEANPDDHGMRLLVVSSFARVGLRTAAMEQLALLPAAVRDAKELSPLVDAVRGLADDAIDACVLADTLRENVRALGKRLVVDDTSEARVGSACPSGAGMNPPPTPSLGEEASEMALPEGLACFRANDGNIARRLNGIWIALRDEIGDAKRALQDHTRAWKVDATQTLVLEGVHPPWLLKMALEARPREALGYRAPVQIVQRDLAEFAMALALTNLSSHLGDGHVHAFVGEAAPERFGAFLKERVDLRLLGTVATTPGTRVATAPSISERVAEAIVHQDQETRRLEREVHAAYAGRDRAWWARRFSEKTPCRVLLLTSRFSTFVKHSTRDLADALIALGHEARVVIQPDDSSSLAACAYLRAVRDFAPDLMIVINYPRATIGDFLPRNLPWVCWIQDQMPHLFDERIGRGLGPLDFTVGHIVAELHSQYGYPTDSSLLLPVPANEAKFFASDASDAEKARFECEIAYVSHQSETPEAQHDRILSELRSNPTVDAALVRALPLLRDAVRSHVSLPLSTLPFPQMKQTVRRSLEKSLGGNAPEHIVDLLTAGYADPLADRIMRHETLEWAAHSARKHGWRFNLYGKGWEKHPTLAEFAKGPLGHDSDLRLSYQLAGCHLQVTYHMLAHPRLCECVLAGGIPLCRLHWIERSMIETWLFRLGWHQGAEFRDGREGEEVRRSPWTDAPALMRFASIFQNLGCFEDAIAPDDRGDFDELPAGAVRDARWGAPFHPHLVRDRNPPREGEHPFAFQMVAEQPELFFHNALMLEERVQCLIANREQRQKRNALARARIAAHHTYRASAAKILAFVASRLTNGTI